MKILSNIYVLLLCLTSFYGFSQQTVTGNVSDQSDNPLPGVAVVIEGTSTGTVTDFDGNYSITVNDGQILVFSYLGYETQRITVDTVTLNIVMLESSSELDEVVVIGYGKTTVKELTGATVQVKGESVERLNIPRMDQALQGQVSGVTINTNSGSPGGSSSIRISTTSRH